jgi:hypothetical protein
VTAFTETWSETVRNLHAILPDTETVRYTRPDGTTARVQSLSVGLLEPERTIYRVDVDAAGEQGQPVTDRFLNGPGPVPDEIIQLTYPHELLKLIAAVIKNDKEQNAAARQRT